MMKCKPVGWLFQPVPFLLCLACAAWLLAACSALGGARSDPAQGLFRAPSGADLPASTQAEAAVVVQRQNVPPAVLLAEQTPHPSPTAPCSDNLKFLKDLTIPDGTHVAPGDMVDKRWQVENQGTCTWNQEYRLRRTTGPELGLPAEIALYPARSGSQVLIRIQMQAPAQAGKVRIAWQAVNPQGALFGDLIYVDFSVVKPTETPPADDGSNSQ